MSESECDLVEGSGNVFRDFAEPDANLKHAKAIVAARIISILDERELTVRKAEELTGYRGRGLLAHPQRESQTFHAGSADEDHRGA